MLRRIHGDGPLPAKIALIGERPGRVENYRGKPFVGPSGEMLNDYLLMAGIDRANCFVTNVVRTYSEEPPSPEEIEADAPELGAELRQCRPTYIGLLGRWAVSVLLPSVPDFEMYWGHGLAFDWRAPWGWCRLMPLYHPAAGMHRTSIQGATAWDFEQFGRMVRGDSVGQYKGTYQPTNVRTELLVSWPLAVAVDTEGSVRRPWCLSYSNQSGNAAVVRYRGHNLRTDTDATTFVMHHALHDLAVLKAMGIAVGRLEDTLLKASLLGIEPLGLKDLARRHLGMRMQTYDELVADARREKALNYLGEILSLLSQTKEEV